VDGERSVWRRLAHRWRQANAVPVPHVTTPGRAAVPYPTLSHPERRTFAQCEQSLLREVVDAAAWSRRLEARGDLSFPVPWLVQPERVRAAMSDDTRGHAPTATQMHAVVDWLVHEGALRALPSTHRDELVRSGIAHRQALVASGWSRTVPSDPPGFAERVEQSYREQDRDAWAVVPEGMLRVYPQLADADDDWRAAAGRAQPPTLPPA
jgi:hypothetical protein